MKKYTVITIVLAALLSVFLLGMNPVNQPAEMLSVADGIWKSDTIEGYDNAYTVVFHTEDGEPFQYVVQEGVSFGEYLPQVPAKENKKGAWLIDGTVDSYLTAGTPLTTNISVTAVYEEFITGGAADYMEGLSGVLKNNNKNMLMTSNISTKRDYAYQGISPNSVTNPSELPVWSFVYAGKYNDTLNYYYVVSAAGYLHIDPNDGSISTKEQGKISISGEPQKIIIENTNGVLKLMSAANTNFTLDWSNSKSDIHSYQGGGSWAYSLYTDTITGKTPVKVTFDVNGGTVNIPTVSVFPGKNLVMPSYNGTRFGYQFMGWAESKTADTAQYDPTYTYTVGNTDVTFYAVWQRSTPVTISLDSNGGTPTGYTFSQYPDVVVDLSGYTVENGEHAFLGWADENGTLVADPAKYTVPGEDTTLHAVWDVIVDINANGGSGDTRLILTPGEALDLSELNVSNGLHVLQGWATTEDGPVAYAADDVLTPSEDTTLYAVWDTDTVYVAFYDNGSLFHSVSYPSAEAQGTIALPSVTERGEDYLFLGWSETQNAREAQVSADAAEMPAPAQDTNLYSVWQHTVTITFEAENTVISFEGENNTVIEPSSLRLVSGTEFPLSQVKLTLAEGDDREFDHWYDGRMPYLEDSTYTVPEEYATLTAEWKAPKYTITFNVNSGTGTLPASVRLRVGESFQLPGWDGTRTDYTFLGWAEGKDKYATGENNRYWKVYRPGEYYTLTKEKDITLYAYWNENHIEKQGLKFGLRTDGIVPHEPNGFNISEYTTTQFGYGGKDVNNPGNVFRWGVQITQEWVLGLDTTEADLINGYVKNNEVVKAVGANNLPTVAEVQRMMSNSGGFDPETQYVVWYVLKYQGTTTSGSAKPGDANCPDPENLDSEGYCLNANGNRVGSEHSGWSVWHVDGVVCSKNNTWVTYKSGLPAGVSFTNMPANYSVHLERGANGNPIPQTVKAGATLVNGKFSSYEPKATGYIFLGWKVEGGDDTLYKQMSDYELSHDVTFVGQWRTPSTTSATVIKSWADEGYADAVRPDEIKVSLWQRVGGVESKTGINGKTLPNSDGTWTFTANNLPQYNSETADTTGEPITYFWREDSVPDQYNVGYNDVTLQTTITNTFTPVHVLEVTKTADKTEDLKVGETVTYTITVTAQETNNVTISNLLLADALEGVTCGQLSATSLAPGASATAYCAYTVTQADVDAGTGITNTVTVTGTDPAGVEVSDNDSVTVSTEDAAAELTLTKTADKKEGLKAGDIITYTVTVENTGNVTVTNIDLTDTMMPEAVKPAAFELTPQDDPVVVTYTYEVTQADVDAGSRTNTASASGTDPSGDPVKPDDVTETVHMVDDAELTLDKTAVIKDADGTEKEKAAVGDIITYTITVDNTGNVTVSNIVLTDNMMPDEAKPAAFALAPADDPVEVTYTYIVTQSDVDAGSRTNTAFAFGKDPKNNEVPAGPETVIVPMVDANAELTLDKTAVINDAAGNEKTIAEVGDIITYTVTVDNTGNVTVSNINLTDTMMPEESKPAVFTLTPQADPVVVTYTYKVTQADVDAGSKENTASVTGTDPSGDPVKPDDVTVTVHMVDPEPELTITKAADKTSNAQVNDFITYTVVVTNTGNVTVSNITLTDTLVDLSSTAVLVDGTVPEGNWQPFVLAPEEVKTVTYRYVITQANVDEGKVENTASVSGTDPQGKPVTPDPVSVTVTTITPAPALLVTKTATIGQATDENGEVTGKSQAELGDVIEYVVKVKNTGNVTVTDIAVEDTLVIAWGESIEHFSLAPNEEKELTHYSYRVQQSDVDNGTIENKATATGHYSDQTVTDDADANVATLQNPGLTVAKTVVGNTTGYKIGDTVQYSIVVTNTGNVTLTNVRVVDAKIGGDWTIPEFAPNETQEYSAFYVVTVNDVVAENILNTVTASATAPNGPVTTDPAQATVTTEKIPVTIQIESAEKIYDGTALEKNEWRQVSGTLAANNVIESVIVSGSQTNRGSSENFGSGAVIRDANDNDVSAAYEFKYLPGTLTVKPRPVTVTANNNEKVYGTADPAFSAVISEYDEANQTGRVGNDEIQFTLSREPGEDVLPGNRRYVISAQPAGAYEEQGGSFIQGNYLVTYYTGLFEISPKPLTITAADASQVFNGTALTKNEYFSSGSIGESGSGLVNGDVLESVAITGSRTDVGYDANVPSNAVIMNNGVDKTGNYAISYVNGTLTVTPRPVTVRADEKSKIWGTPDPTLTYSIDEYIENVNEHSGLVAGDSIVPVLSREAGEDEGVYTINAAPDGTYETDSEGRYLQGNYAVAYIPATLSIGRLPLEIKASNLTETYNGQAWTKNSYQSIPAGMLLEGDHVGSVTVKGSQTLVGTSPNTPSNAVILDAVGNDVTARYQIVYTPGLLKVTKADITITAMDAFKYYDGTPLTKNGPSDYSQTGLISGDVISSVTITGSRTEVGEADNVPSNAVIMHNGVDVTESCYNVTYIPGKLVVAEKLSLIITANSETKRYDGITLVNNGYTVSGLDEGDSVDSVIITGGLKLVGEQANVPSNAKIVDKDKNDITVKYAITYNDGLLKVTERPLTVTASGGTKVYDGTELKVQTYTSSGLVNNETENLKDTIESITITGSQTVVGHSDNVPVVTLIRNQSGEDVTSCYSIEHVNGTLNVTPKKVMILAGSDTKVYDGTALTKTDGFTSMPFSEGEDGNGLLAGDHIDSLTVTGSQTNYGSSSNVPSEAKIVNASGEDVTANYEFVYSNGTLNVTQRPVTITADSAQKYYDGKPLTKDAIVLPVDNLVTGHSVSSVTVTGSQTKAGGKNNNIASNAAIADANGVDVTDNYTITYAPGTLKVLPLSLTITAASGEKIYDGTALTKNGENDYTHSPLAEGDKITQITLTGTQTIVGKSANIPSAANIVNGAGESVMSCYTITWVRGELKVNPRPITIIANSDTKVYDGTALTADGYTTRLTNEGMTGNVLGEGDHIDDVTITGSQTVVGNSNNVPSDPWIYDSEGRYANGNYEITFVNGTLEVTPKTVTITAASDSKVYDGTALTKDEILETVGLADGDVVSARTVTGSQTIVGSSNNVPSDAKIANAAGEDVTDSYNIIYVNGTLAVTRKQITITAGSDSKEYDGTPLKVNTWTISSDEGLGTGDSVQSVVLTGEQTVYGTSNNVASNAKIVNANDEDVTASYEIHYETGTLGITKKPITITADSDDKVYDGTALRKNSYTSDLLAEGDSFNEVTVTGTQTVVGTSGNVPSAAKILNASNQNVTDSYEITYANGTLEVTPKAITITADSDTKVYDGTALTKDSYTNDSLASGDKIDSITVTGSQTIVGTSDNVPSAAKIVDGYGNDVTASYTITYANGTLEVTQKTVTITADSGTKVYDGTALTKETFTNTALADGDKVDSVVNTGSQVVVGSSDNVPSAAKIVNAEGEDVTASYAITYANGILEVTPKAVTITADSDTKVYDGTALTKDSCTNTDLAENDSIEAVTVTGSQIVAGTSNNVPSAAKIVNAKGEDVTASYTITYANGSLEVTPKTLTINADGATKEYDGTALTKDSYTIAENALAEGDTIDSVTLTGSQIVAGNSGNVPSDAKIINTEGKDVTASYTITYVKGTLEVTKKPVTITADSDSKMYDGTPLTKDSYTIAENALAEGDSISAVKIEGSQTVVGSSYNVARDAVIINAVGADVTGSYEITYVRGVLEVIPNTSLIITANSDTKVYDGTALTNNGYTHTILAPGDRIESVTVSGSQTIVGNSANVPSAAKIVNTAGVDVTASYGITYNNGTLTVTPKALTITAASDTKEYDGTALTNAGYTNTALAEDDSIESVTVAGSQTIVGESDNTPSGAVIRNAAGEDVTNCYTITYPEGTLKVTPKSVTITANSDTKVYDGKALTNDGYTNTTLAADDSIESVTVDGSQTVVGSSANVASAAVIRNAAGDDVTASYTISYTDGTLEVTPKTVLITALNDTKPYDGTALTRNEYTNTELAEGDSIDAVTITGSQIVYGTSANVPSEAKIVNAEGVDVTASYIISYKSGTLEITRIPMTITAGSDTKMYDGTPLTNNTHTDRGLVDGDSVNAVAIEGSQTNVGSSPNVASNAVIYNAAGEDVTDSYIITYIDGLLEVTADQSVIITAASDTKIYDGTALTNGGYEITKLAEGDSLRSVDVNGSQTIVGESANVPSNAVIENAAGDDVTGNYGITYRNGTLTVTPKALTITAASDSKIYDGEALTNDGYENTALAEGDSIESVTVTGSQTIVGSSDNTPSNAVIKNAAGEDVTNCYVISYPTGTLTVTPKALTITANSGEKVYDGEALTNDGYTNTALAAGDSIESVAVNGSQIIVGQSANVASAAVIRNAAGDDVTASYAITYVDGNLKVTPKDLTITAASDNKVYDGEALTNAGYTNTALAVGDSIESVAVNGSQTIVGSSANAASSAVIKNAAGEDVTASYAITYIDGTLTVTPKTLTITANSDTKTYDGEALTNAGYTNTALATGDSIESIAVNGSQTIVGSSANTASAAVIKNAAGEDVTACYTITYPAGTLTVTPKTLTITAASDTKEYDGTALTNAGYTNTALAAGDSIESVNVAGSQTIVGSSGNTGSAAVIRNAAGEDVTASYAITYVDGTLTVTPKALTITAASDTKEYDGAALTNGDYTNTALAEGDIIESVTVEGSQLTVGSSANTASAAVIKNAAGEDVTACYTITYPVGTLEVTPKAVTITALGDTKPYDGTALTRNEFTNTILAEGDSIEAVTITGSRTVYGTSANVPSEAKIVNAAGEDVTASYTIRYTNGSLEITRIPMTITAGSDTKIYDGTPLTNNTHTDRGLVEGESVNAVTIEGSQTNVGSSDNVPSNAVIHNAAGDDVTDSYSITYINGLLEVTADPSVIITAANDTKVYDGTALTNGGYTITKLAEGDSLRSVDVNGSQTIVGESANVPSNAVIVNGAGVDVTGNYGITYVNGTLTVTPKALTISAASGTKEYDGTALTNGEYTSTALAEGDSIESVTVTGSQTTVGESDNTPSGAVIRNAAGEDVTASYAITYSYGTLTVTPKALTITAASDSQVYDGTALTNDGYDNTALAEGDSIESVTVAGSQTTVGESDNTPSNAVIRNAAGEDVTGCYTITYPTGTLTVTPKAVTITAASDNKVYDGEALINSGYTNTALADGDIIESVTVAGSQTIVGSSANTGSAAVIHNAAGEDVTASYTITYVDGTLTVTPKALTITAASGTKEYDGTALTDGEYTSTALAEGDSIESVTVTGSQTTVGESDNTPSGAVIRNAAGEDVTACYTITYPTGTLTVTPKALTITVNSETKVYDGIALTNDGYTNTSLAAGDSIESVNVAGSQTIVGSSANTGSAAVIRNAAGEDMTASYTISYIDGTLTVTPKALTITAASDTKEYDGAALTNDEFTSTALAEGDTIESVTVEGSQITVGESFNTPSGAVIRNEAGEDVTSCYTISYPTGTLEVTPKAVIITALGDTKAYDGTALTRNAYTNTEIAEGDSIEAVTITGSQTVYGASANVPSGAKIVNAAGEDVTASYTISYANGSLEITRIPVTITAGSDTKIYDGTPLTNDTYTVSGLMEGDSVNTVTIEGSQTNAGSSPNVPSAAVIHNAAGEDVTDSYIISYINGLLEVTSNQNVIITAASDTKVYDGKALTNEGYTSSSLVPGDSLASVTVEGAQTIVGTSNNIPSGAVIVNAAGEDVTGNYGITYVNGTLTVTPKALTITAASGTKEYDGTALTNGEYTSTALAEGDSIESVVVTGSQTTVGSSDNVSSGAVIRNAAGEDVTACYTITYPTGTLTVTPKALTITAASDNKVYDGEALTNDDYSSTALAAGDSIESVNIAGSQTTVGESDNTPSNAVIRNAAGEDVTDCYTITYPTGTLTVTPKSLTITAASDYKVYDGSALTNNGYTNTAPATGDSIESVNVEGSQTVVGSSANIGSAAVIRNADGEDVTESYIISYVNGTLEVTKKAMIIAAGSATKIYDGTPLINDTYTDTGLVGGDSVGRVTIEGSQTNVGTSANIASNAAIINAAGEDVTASYDITYVDGLLEVTATQALIITAASDSKTYDGAPLMNDGYTFSNLMPGDTLSSVIVRGAVTNVGTMPNIPSSAVIVNADGEDVTNNYSITYVPGMLVVTPRALKITAASDAKVYDGSALTNEKYTYVGLTENDRIESAVVEGSQTNVGTKANKVSNAVVVNAAEQDVTANYNIEYVDGELNVSPKPITITAKNGTKIYDGKALTVNDYTATATAEGDSIRFVVLNGSQTYVGTSANVPSDAVIRNEAGQNVTANYTITYVDNTLEVTPMRITITAAKAEKVYDGTALTNSGYTSSSLAEGDRIDSVVLTGSQTNVGTSANVPSEAVIVDRLGRDVSSNYIVTYAENTLTVTPMTVRITAGSTDKVYDGKELTENSFTNSKLASGDSVESVVVTGSQVNVGSSANTGSEAVIRNEAGEDVSSNYEIIYVDGTLTVTPKPIIIKAASEERIYNSEELTNSNYTVEAAQQMIINLANAEMGDSTDETVSENMTGILAEGDVIDSVTVTGSRINVGTSPNVASGAVIVNGEGANVTDNYMIKYYDGALTVLPRPVTVTAQDQTKEFGQDDKPFTAEVEGTLNSDPIEYEITREPGEEPGSYPITPSGEELQGNYIVTYVPAALTITYNPNSMAVTKVWVDDNNRDGIRPVSLTVTLTGSDGSVYTRRLNDANSWTAVVDDLPLYYNDSPIEYTWTEETVSGYTAAVAVEDNLTVFTNTHEISRTSISVNKVWDDNNNIGGTRPETLSVRLQSNGTTILGATLNETNGWSATVNNLPMNENGRPIQYTWTEQAVSGYYPVGSATFGNNTTFTNSNIYLLTIHYIYESGEMAAEDYSNRQSYGSTFNVESPIISGFVADNEVILGTMPARDIEFTVIYKSDGSENVTPTVVPTVTPVSTETPVPTLIPHEEPEPPKDIPEPRIVEPDDEHPIVVPEPSYLIDIDDLDTALGLGEVFINNSGYALE